MPASGTERPRPLDVAAFAQRQHLGANQPRICRPRTWRRSRRQSPSGFCPRMHGEHAGQWQERQHEHEVVDEQHHPAEPATRVAGDQPDDGTDARPRRSSPRGRCTTRPGHPTPAGRTRSRPISSVPSQNLPARRRQVRLSTTRAGLPARCGRGSTARTTPSDRTAPAGRGRPCRRGRRAAVRQHPRRGDLLRRFHTIEAHAILPDPWVEDVRGSGRRRR